MKDFRTPPVPLVDPRRVRTGDARGTVATTVLQ
jgi:hypothetical protein